MTTYVAGKNAERGDMDLPGGKCCDDCKWLKRCVWLLQREGDEVQCDWSPSRFQERKQK